MLSTRQGIAKLIDYQAVFETFIVQNYALIEPRPGWKVLDIGASIGDYSIYASLKGAHVMAYECDLFCEAALRKNAKRYNFQVNMQRVFSLESLPKCNLAKIDIEGYEFQLDGLQRCEHTIAEVHLPYGTLQQYNQHLQSFGHSIVAQRKIRGDLIIVASSRMGKT